MKKLGFILCLTLIFTMMLGIFAFANDPINLQDSLDDISKSDGVIGDEAKEKVAGLSKDGLDIVGILVMGIVSISGLWMTVLFTRTQNPTAKTALRASIIGHILGFFWLANYFGFMNFGFDKLKIF